MSLQAGPFPIGGGGGEEGVPIHLVPKVKEVTSESKQLKWLFYCLHVASVSNTAAA